MLEKQEIGYLYVIFMIAFFMRVYSFHNVGEKMLLLGIAGAVTYRLFVLYFPTINHVGVP